MLAYIGPGPGLAIQAPFLVLLLALLAAAVSLLAFPLRYLRRRRFRAKAAKARQVVVLGLDGLEPSRVERLMAEGRLPHLAELRRQGGYQRLATTCPPLSPVAWSSFSTGVNPGRHGIFGFVERDKDYQLRLTSASFATLQARLGSIPLPWTVEKPVYQRKSTSFWKLLGQAGVLTHVLRVPITWPPEKFDGFLLSAMGAPDLMGTQGTHTLFSVSEQVQQHGHFSPLRVEDGRLQGQIVGPLGRVLLLEVRDDSITVAGQRIALAAGQSSRWIGLNFGSARGLAQFTRLDAGSVYMSPLQIDPARPATPITWPPLFSMALSRLCGSFATCGLAEDTGAREDGVLSDHAFLEQAYSIHQERETQLFHLLDRTTEGCLLAVFDGPDRIQHMFSGDGQEAVLDEMYLKMDRLVGETRDKMSPEGVLLVLSDHGFKPLRTLVDVNAWLAEAGFLRSRDGLVHWPESQASVYNLSGIRLNQRGREAQGMVDPDQALALLQAVRQGLLQLRYHDQVVFQDVFLASSIYQGPYIERAPDLVLGFAPGFGIYKDASRGKVSDRVFHGNDSAWSGDHGFHPEAVPGVLFCNRPLRDGAHIMDLSATVLDLFGLETPPWMEGRSLLPKASAAPLGGGGQAVELEQSGSKVS